MSGLWYEEEAEPTYIGIYKAANRLQGGELAIEND